MSREVLAALAAVVVVVAAIKLAQYGDIIAVRTGLSGFFIGTLLIAGSTSLPELLSSISAIAQGAPSLAAGGMFGSTMFNMFILAILDLLHQQARILRRVAVTHALTASLTNLLAGLAEGRRFLNLFGYTGAASVYAARGGASTTTTIDMSNTYLEWARQNMALNGFQGPEHQFVRVDCREWLARGGGGVRYGLIFLDPPSFSSSKRMEGTLDIQRDHVELIRNAAGLLEPDGVLIFSNNLRGFKMDREALAGLQVEDISRETLPKDFERNPKIHNCWRIALSG